MLFLGSSLIGDSSSYTLAPSNVTEVNHVTLEDGVFDTLCVNDDVIKYDIDSPIPEKWDVSTIMFAKFDDSTSAGAFDVDIDLVDGMLIKRCEIGDLNPEHKWLTINYIDVSGLTPDEKIELLNSPYYDNTNKSMATYEYAITLLSGTEEIGTVSSLVESSFDGIFITDDEQTWGTIVTDAFVNTTRNIAKSYQTTLNYRYPVVTTAAVINYDSGNATGEFVPFDPEACQLIYEDATRNAYQKRFMDFLTNYKAKILKTMDGRIWLVDVNPSPTDSANGIYYRRNVSFNWTEIGDYNSQADMYYNKLYDVPEKYWKG